MADDTPPIVNRLPRSLEESFSYHPDWRIQQVKIYTVAAGHARNHGYSFSIPTWEDDEEVLRFYAYKNAGGVFETTDTPRYFYANEAIDHNLRTGQASRFRALACCMQTVDSIATRFGTSKNKIETFYKLHFDILHHRDNKEMMSSVVFPHTIPRGETMDLKKERLWRCYAFLMGLPGYEAAVYRQLTMNEADLEEINKKMRWLMAANGLDWCMMSRTKLPSSQDIQNVIEMSKVQLVDDPERNAKGKSFTEGLIALERASRSSRLQLEQTEQVSVTTTTRPGASSNTTTTTTTTKKRSNKAIFDFGMGMDEPVYYSGENDGNPLALQY